MVSAPLTLESKQCDTCIPCFAYVVPRSVLQASKLLAELKSGMAEMLCARVQALGSRGSLLVSIFPGVPGAVGKVYHLGCCLWLPCVVNQAGPYHLQCVVH